MSMFYRSSSAIIAPNLTRDLNLSPHELGVLGAVFFYSFALVQLPMGILLDRIGSRRTMTALNFMAVMGAIIFAKAGSLVGASVGRALLGVGMAGNFIGSLKLLSGLFDLRKFATMSGLIVAIGSLGSLAATSPLAILCQKLGWRGSFYLFAGINTVLAICLFALVGEPSLEGGNQSDFSRKSNSSMAPLAYLRTLFSKWNYWAISWSIFLRYGAFASIQALWAGPFLIECLRLPPVLAGNLLLMVSVGYTLGAPVGGMLSDRIFRSRKKTLILAIAVSSVATLILAQWKNPLMFYALGGILFLLGFSNSFTQISYAHIREIMPEEMSGTAMAGVNFFTMMGGGVFIHGIGCVIEEVMMSPSGAGQAYQMGFMICFLAFVASLLLYATTRDSTIRAQKCAVPSQRKAI